MSEAIPYQGKPLDLNNTITNSQYLEKLVCQVLVLQSIPCFAKVSGNNIAGAHYLREVDAGSGTEDAVDDRVSCTVERSQALDEHRYSHLLLAHRDVSIHIEQVKHKERAPTHDEY